MSKAEFLQHITELKRINKFQLYDMVFKQAVYSGTHEQCERVLQTSINPAYHKDFVILEVESI